MNKDMKMDFQNVFYRGRLCSIDEAIRRSASKNTYNIVYMRLVSNWEIEKALNTPYFEDE
jgi:hypothetical protein